MGAIAVFCAALAFTSLVPGFWKTILPVLFPGEDRIIQPNINLANLVLEHAAMVSLASVLNVIIAVPLGILVTRKVFRELLPVANTVTSIGQTFPPVAILALAVPVLGFGAKATVLALWIYGLLPVLRNTVSGIQNVAETYKQAGRGMGMSRARVLAQVELPLSMNVIIAGIRTSVIINIGTATIGATIGAGGLGRPVIGGLVSQNPAFTLQGAVPVILMALIADGLLRLAEQFFFRQPDSA